MILCGRGGSINSDQVQQTRDTLLSDPRESALLAEADAAGSMVGSSASIHAQLLADDVKMQADTLSVGTPPADQRDRIQLETDLAQDRTDSLAPIVIPRVSELHALWRG